MKIGIVTWLWKPHQGYKSKYTTNHVNIFYSMFKRNSTIDCDFFCVTDNPDGLNPDIKVIPIWDVPFMEIRNKLKPNCYRRLKMYSAEAKEIFNVNKLISFDIDAVIVANIDHLLTRDEDFVGWRNVTGVKYQGSLTSHILGTREIIWKDYIADPVKARIDASYLVGSDQAWVSHKLSKDEGVFTPKDDGVYSYKKSIRPAGNILPNNACVIFFHGMPKADSSGMDTINWIKENYK